VDAVEVIPAGQAIDGDQQGVRQAARNEPDRELLASMLWTQGGQMQDASTQPRFRTPSR
jgi:hypothetical protein